MNIEGGKRRGIFVSLGIVAIALALRLAAALDDFWLDEIWSWGHVQVRVKSAWDVLFTLRHDNNHLLNSWWICLLGPEADDVWYRLPAVVFGSLTVLLARQVVAKSGPVAVGMVTLLTLPSYFLIHYSSEARGYGYEMFFCLAAFVLQDRMLEDVRSDAQVDRSRRGCERIPVRLLTGIRMPCGESKSRIVKARSGIFSQAQRWMDRGLFAAACVGGALSHPTFLMMFLTLGVWGLWAVVRSQKTWLARIGWLCGTFATPAGFIGLLWLVNYSRMQIGGGDPQAAWVVALSTLSLMVGGPELGDMSLLIGLLTGMAIVGQLVHMARTHDDRWVCAAAMIVIPAAILAATGTGQIYPRYLLGTVMVMLPMLALLLSRWFSQGVAGRSAVAVLIAASLLGNGWQLARLYRDGRGHAREVVAYLRDHSAEGPILVGSDQRFRHGLILDYFGRRLHVNERLVHFGEGPWPPGGPQWVLMHSQDAAWEPEASYTDPQGQRYELRRVFPYAGLSGWRTGVYENVTFQKTANPQAR